MFRQMFQEKYMRFPDGKCKALAFSYDDGVAADKKLIEIFNRYSLKGTFNLNSSLFNCKNWHNRLDELETFNLFKGGVHEVAMHGARHIFMDKVPLHEAAREITLNREYLENRFERVITGLAYAYNGYNDEIVQMIKTLGVSYARVTTPSYSFDIPNDWLRLKPTCHHNDNKFSELCEKFITDSPERQFKHREAWLFLIWGHSYEFDDNGNWSVIESFAKRISAEKDVWFATCGEIFEYVTAFNNLIFSLDGERVKNPSAIPVWLEIRGKIYKIGAGREIVFIKEDT